MNEKHILTVYGKVANFGEERYFSVFIDYGNRSSFYFLVIDLSL